MHRLTGNDQIGLPLSHELGFALGPSIPLRMAASGPIIVNVSAKAEYDLLIAPGRGGLPGALAECWQHRELLYFLAWRDLNPTTSWRLPPAPGR